MAWLRLYDTLPDDPKVQLLAPELFRTWINLLCVACRTRGALPPVTELAFTLRMTPQTVTTHLDALIKATLIDKLPSGCFTPHNWKKRQFASDSSVTRVRRYRKRYGNGAVTPPDTDTDTDTDKTKEANASLGATNGHAKPKRGSQIAKDWQLDDRDRDLAARHGLVSPGLEREAEKFQAHHQKCGSVFKDWHAAWKTWVLNYPEFKSRGGKNGKPTGNPWVEALLAEGTGSPFGDADDVEQ